MNITYLLGAGASYNALPVINELPRRLQEFVFSINKALTFLEENVVVGVSYVVNKSDFEFLKSEIEWLLNEMDNHKTVDTLAKKFYVLGSRESDLLRLKKILISYFLYEQSFSSSSLGDYSTPNYRAKEIPDKRYDSFIATVISKERNNLSLAPNFKIVTWNYDLQFELAYKRYLETPDFKIVQQKLQAIPSLLFQNEKFQFNQSKFGLIRINGVAGSLSMDIFDDLPQFNLFEARRTYIVGRIVHKFANMLKEEMSVFNYSWESKEQFESIHSEKQTLIEVAQKVMQETDLLVVIGYSFPNFNRSVDKVLLSELKGLKKVYVQDVNAEEVCELIKSSFELFKWLGSKQFDVDFRTKTDEQVPVIPVKGVDQFFIPPEAEI